MPDTVLGRFDMIVLHLVLLLRRLRAGEAAHRALAQGVFDAFCRDMDDNLREMGISDQGVPRQMRKVGEAFYGRAQAYEAALAEPGDDGAGGGARPQRLCGGGRTAGCGRDACRPMCGRRCTIWRRRRSQRLAAVQRVSAAGRPAAARRGVSAMTATNVPGA